MIGVIDIGVCNTASIKNALLQLGYYPKVVRNRFDLFSCSHVIMPGVGHFDSVINSLRLFDLYDALLEYLSTPGRYYLGICVGMQILFTKSEEGEESGLGIFEGGVSRFRCISGELLPPNMGKQPIFDQNVNTSALRFYFMHSYSCIYGLILM